MPIEIESAPVSRHPDRHFHNIRTGEVVLAHSDEVVGRVTHRGDRFVATVFGFGVSKREFACAADAVTHIVREALR